MQRLLRMSGIAVKRLLADKGVQREWFTRTYAFWCAQFLRCTLSGACHQAQLRATYRPQSNGKAERFIQSAVREGRCWIQLIEATHWQAGAPNTAICIASTAASAASHP